MNGRIQAPAGTVPALSAAAAQHFGFAPAFTCLDHTLSHHEVDQLSEQVAAWLHHESGLAPGARVALQLPNILQYPVLALGILKAGLVLVNVNPQYTPAELLYQLRDSAAAGLVVLANHAHVAASILAETQVRCVIVTQLFDLHPQPQRSLLNAHLRFLRRAGRPCTFRQSSRLRRVLREGAALLRQHGRVQAALRADHLALLQYTGGTTGVARAAMLSHANLLDNLAQLRARLVHDMPGAGAVMLAPLPLYHIYAFTLGLLNGLAQGHHLLLIPDPRDLPALLKAIVPWRLAGILGINPLYQRLAEEPGFAAIDCSGLQLCSAGGMALAPEVAVRWKRLTGCDILEGYGLSECAPLVACNTSQDLRSGTVGRAVPGTQICLKDEAGGAAAPGQPGEVCVKGPQVMHGYWPPGSTQERMAFDAEGWFHTGDVGVLDADGYLSIVDRIKDVIIVSGFNVYPNEIEELACRHPQISDACAVGVGDEFAVQIKLFVVARSPALGEEDVIRWCRQGLAPYKVPRQVEFRPFLPKSNVGKVLRKELRAASGTEDRFTV